MDDLLSPVAFKRRFWSFGLRTQITITGPPLLINMTGVCLNCGELLIDYFNVLKLKVGVVVLDFRKIKSWMVEN